MRSQIAAQIKRIVIWGQNSFCQSAFTHNAWFRVPLEVHLSIPEFCQWSLVWVKDLVIAADITSIHGILISLDS